MTEKPKSKPTLAVQPLAGYDPQVAEALWRLENARARTLAVLNDVAPDLIDLDVEGNSIGTILYHLALIEADWLYSEILVQPIPKILERLFGHEDRSKDGTLTSITGQSLEEHLSRLKSVRENFLDSLRGMDAPDFNRLRNLDEYNVSPAWVLHHLAQHEAEHRAELGAVIAQARR